MSSSKVLLYSTFTVVFLVLCIFFIFISPTIPYYGDDWRYLSQYRTPLPSLKDWNPARVFPEIIFPFLGYVSTYFVNLICGDYIKSISLTFSIFFALSITFLSATIYFFIQKFSKSKITSLYSMFLFIILSFFIFKSKNEGNIYLFYSDSLTYLVYYQLSNILNSILIIFILYFHFFGSSKAKHSYYSYGTILLLIYFSQFSLTFSSITAATCAFSVILLRFWHQAPHNVLKKSLAYLRSLTPFDGILFFILACWLSAACMDMLGPRYAAFPRHEFNFSAALRAFCGLLHSMRKEMLNITLAAFLGSILLILYRKRRNTVSYRESVALEVFFTVCLSTILTFLAYLFITAKTEFGYAGMISATYGVFFFQILLTVFCITYLLTEIPLLKIFAPALLCFLFIAITNSQRPWAVSYTPLQRALVESWIADARRADAAGEKNLTITVPSTPGTHPKKWFAAVLAHTLYSHGVTSRPLHISLKESCLSYAAGTRSVCRE